LDLLSLAPARTPKIMACVLAPSKAMLNMDSWMLSRRSFAPRCGG
jgi:hypothetical protein